MILRKSIFSKVIILKKVRNISKGMHLKVALGTKVTYDHTVHHDHEPRSLDKSNL